MAEEVKGFANLMRYCNTLEDYEQKKADGKVTDDVLVIVLEDKLIKFKGYTFNLSGEGSGEGGSITIDDVLSATSTNPVTSKAIKEYVDLHPQYEKVDEIEVPDIEGIEGLTNFLTEITYSDLVNLRDNNSLIPGMKYRIIDYETTTSTLKTQSAGHVFDIIVTALSSSVLDENARAIQSVRDTDGYFNNSNLSAWRLLYSLDNDTSRFRWAVKVGSEITIDFLDTIFVGYLNGSLTLENVTYYKWECDASFFGMTVNILTDTETPSEGETVKVLLGEEVMEGFPVVSVIKRELNGFGVIYNMVDEYNNSLPYDFKNIMFSRKLTNYIYDEENGIETFVYTFDDLSSDASIVNYNDVSEPGVYNNFIPLSSSLPNNVFINDPEGVVQYYNNIFGVFSVDNTFGYCAINNNLGGYFCNNIAKYWFEGNHFMGGARDNRFGENCYNNIFYGSTYENIIGENFEGNLVEAGFSNNIIGRDCSYNKFGGRFKNVTLGGEDMRFGIMYSVFSDVANVDILRDIPDTENSSYEMMQNILFLNTAGFTNDRIVINLGTSKSNCIIKGNGLNSPTTIHYIDSILGSGTEL